MSDNLCLTYFFPAFLHKGTNYSPQALNLQPESEFNEFEPCLKFAKNRFQLSAGLNLETLNTILSETNDI